MDMSSPEIFYGQHEDASEAMFDHMLEDQDLKEEFEKYEFDVKKDGAFIKDLIRGTPRSRDQYERVSSVSYVICHSVQEHRRIACLWQLTGNSTLR